MNYSYFNAAHFTDFSCSRRRVGGLDLFSQHQNMSYDLNTRWLSISNDLRIFNYINKLVGQQPCFLGIWKRKSIRLGKVKFKYVRKHYSSGKPGYMVKVVGKDLYTDDRYFRDDMDFLHWFIVNYDFEGFGSNTTDNCICEMLLIVVRGLLHELLTNFHESLVSDSPRLNSQSHRVDHTVNVYLTLMSVQSALLERTFKLPTIKDFNRKPRSELAIDFEAVVNQYNGTNFNVVGQWFNEETDRKDAEQLKDLVLEMVRCIKQR